MGDGVDEGDAVGAEVGVGVSFVTGEALKDGCVGKGAEVTVGTASKGLQDDALRK